ncbi:MAG: TetR family transcriptional regulator [Lachnospiraceae bacterium]|nr:TetR family transcriptional regulator [Lachnospiraceae bacterium]
MVKGTPELITERREEIINACEKLYKKLSFKEITLKEIGKATSFSRPTIYNYFETKEEIFLALYEREYIRWNEELESIYADNKKLTNEQLADKISASLANRQQLLKLLAMNNYDMEANSREVMLVSFKVAFGESINKFKNLLKKFCVKMSDDKIERFIFVFFPFMFGIYPYTNVTEKQRKAMKKAKIDFVYQTIYDLTYKCLIELLKN